MKSGGLTSLPAEVPLISSLSFNYQLEHQLLHEFMSVEQIVSDIA